MYVYCFKCKKLKRENKTQCKKPERRAKSNKLKRKQREKEEPLPETQRASTAIRHFNGCLVVVVVAMMVEVWTPDTWWCCAHARDAAFWDRRHFFKVIKCATGFAFVLIFFSEIQLRVDLLP